MVGVTGFEPTTSWSRTKRSTKLSYTPGAVRSKPLASSLVKHMLLVVVASVVFFAGCDDTPHKPQPIAPAACMVISRPVASAFVGGGQRHPLTRPTCGVFQSGTVAWADDKGVHVDVDGRVVDAIAGPSQLQGRPCLAGVAIGPHKALVQGKDGVVAVTSDAVSAVALPRIDDDERVVAVDSIGNVVVGRRKQHRVVNLDGSAANAIVDAHDGKVDVVGHVEGDALVFDDGHRIDVGFAATSVDTRGGVVVASAEKTVRGYIDGRLVYSSDRGERPLRVTAAGIYIVRNCHQLVRVGRDGESVVVDPKDGVTSAGVAYEGNREAAEFAVDKRDRILVRERLRGLDCGLRDVITLVDESGAHVVADGDGARVNVGFFRDAPAWVESTLSYEPLADVSGTSDP